MSGAMAAKASELAGGSVSLEPGDSAWSKAEEASAAEQSSSQMGREADQAQAEAAEAPAVAAEGVGQRAAEEAAEAQEEAAAASPDASTAVPASGGAMEEASDEDEEAEAPADQAAKEPAAEEDEEAEAPADEAAEEPGVEEVGGKVGDAAEAAEEQAEEAVDAPAAEAAEAPAAETSEVPAAKAEVAPAAEVEEAGAKAEEAAVGRAAEAHAEEGAEALAADTAEVPLAAQAAEADAGAPADEAMEAPKEEEEEEEDIPAHQPDPVEKAARSQAADEPLEELGGEAAGAAPEGKQGEAAAAPEAAEAALVLLLVGDADGSHQPQVFRMRSDQPLQRLLVTYAKFRQFASDDGLSLSRVGQERLDATLTAGALGLANGDIVTVHGAAGKTVEPLQAEKPLVAAVAAPAQKRKAPQQPQQPQQRRRRTRGEEPVPEPAEKESEEQQQPKRPPTAYFLWYNENRQAIVKELGSTSMCAAAKAAGERWKVLTPEEKAPFEARVADLKSDYDQAMSAFLERGGVPKRRASSGAAKGAQPALWKQLKRPRGGAFGEFLRLQQEDIKRSMVADAQAGDVSREAERRWKDLAEEVKQGYQESFDQKLSEYRAALREHKSSPVGLTRSARATGGPAAGWVLHAWRNARKSVCWKITEPKTEGRAGRVFHDFKDLRRSVEAPIYRQLNNLVRKGLLARLNDKTAASSAVARSAKATATKGFQTPKKRQQASAREDGRQLVAEAAPRQKRPRGDLETPWQETPDRLEKPLLATQVFTAPEALRPRGEAWTCGSLARLTRHSRCGKGGAGQPQLIHVKKASVTIGRAETCDIQLSSARTPQMLSRCHAVLSSSEDGGFILADKGSVNGCLVNGRSVQKECVLRNGDVITFGVQTLHPEFDYVFETRRGAY